MLKKCTFDLQNENLATISRQIYGDDLTLMVVDPHSLRLATKNARILSKDTFQQLTANIKKDRRLSSVPLCYRSQDSHLDVLSGNHRVEASIQAGISQILVMVIEEDLTQSQRIAIQLSHNALVGTDDATLLADLWKQIDDIDSKLYTGLSSDEIEKLEKVNLVTFSTPQIVTRTVTFAFVDSEMKKFQKVLAQLEALPAKEFYLADLKEFDRFYETMQSVQRKFDVKNLSLSLLTMLDICDSVLAQKQKTQEGKI